MELLSWNELYDYWRICSRSEPEVFKKPIEPVEIPVQWKDSGSFYGLDWLSRSEFDQRKRMIETNIAQFLLFTKPTNKGTIHTLRMLTEATNEEEKAAIWLYAFSQELMDMCRPSDASRYASQIQLAAYEFLAPKFYMWHHAMKKLMPETYTTCHVFSQMQLSSFKLIVELARLNAAIVLHEYVPVLYTSLEPGIRKDGFSLRK